jgi:hypothetical protein
MTTATTMAPPPPQRRIGNYHDGEFIGSAPGGYIQQPMLTDSQILGTQRQQKVFEMLKASCRSDKSYYDTEVAGLIDIGMVASESKEEKKQTVVASDTYTYGATVGNQWLKPLGRRGQLSIVIFPELSLADTTSEDAAAQHRLKQRQKQLDIGKRTQAYANYIELIPKHTRRRRWHPDTPNPMNEYSKREWDGLCKKWRRQLHAFDCRFNKPMRR